MICRHCGREIKREPEHDKHVQGSAPNFKNRVTEAWTDSIPRWTLASVTASWTLACVTAGTWYWHEPISQEEVIAGLQLIVSDLR